MLTIHEIYVSVQGESTHVGRPCVFVRLTACDLRCRWCDTPYAFTGGRKASIDEVVAEVERHGTSLVEITGGEPLLQRDVYPLMERLLERGHEVLLETGGHVPLDDVPEPVIAIVDVKCPGSGEAGRMHWPNLEQLSPHDEVKFVIADRADFEYAAEVDRALSARRTRRGGAVFARPRRARPGHAHEVDSRRAPAGAAADSSAQVHLERGNPRRVMAADSRAVVLLSGGLDSTTAAAYARREGWTLYALTIKYGQIHHQEIEAARSVAQAVGAVRHVELDVDLSAFGGSSLTGHGEIPKDRAIDAQSRNPPIPQSPNSITQSPDHQIPRFPPPDSPPSTYVPARNTVFLALALGWAEVIGAERIVIGVNAIDYSGYPDCRPEFIAAFEYLATLATRAGVDGRPLRIWAPLQQLTKAGIVRLGLELGVDFSITHSCYDPAPDGRPCQRCDSCQLRARGFAEAGVPDPLLSLAR